MKTLMLLRHAKSSWDNASLDDFERPLNDRGRKAAATVGKYLADRNASIDLIISSPAVRTRETIERSNLESIAAETRFDQRIYEASSARLMEVVSQIDEDRKAVLLVGHNPGMEELLLLLTGIEERMQTAALATIVLDVKRWDRVAPGKGTLESLIRAKELKSGK
jgi:phosphohistidine phosphatase